MRPSEFLASLSPGTAARIAPDVTDTAPAESKYHLLVLAEGQPPAWHSYGDVGSLREALVALMPGESLLAPEVRIYVWYGLRLFTTRPPRPTLILPSGELLPLYDVRSPLDLATDGLLGFVPSLEPEGAEDEDLSEEPVATEEEAEFQPLPFLTDPDDPDGLDDEPDEGQILLFDS